MPYICSGSVQTSYLFTVLNKTYTDLQVGYGFAFVVWEAEWRQESHWDSLLQKCAQHSQTPSLLATLTRFEAYETLPEEYLPQHLVLMGMSQSISLQAYQSWYKYTSPCQGRIQVCQWMWKSWILEQRRMLQEKHL